MTGIWAQMALVFGLALIATLVSNKLRISTALSEIIVGMLARAIFSVTVGVEIFGVQEPCEKSFPAPDPFSKDRPSADDGRSFCLRKRSTRGDPAPHLPPTKPP